MNLNTDSLLVYFEIQTKLKSQAKHLKKKKKKSPATEQEVFIGNVKMSRIILQCLALHF